MTKHFGWLSNTSLINVVGLIGVMFSAFTTTLYRAAKLRPGNNFVEFVKTQIGDVHWALMFGLFPYLLLGVARHKISCRHYRSERQEAFLRYTSPGVAFASLATFFTLYEAIPGFGFVIDMIRNMVTRQNVHGTSDVYDLPAPVFTCFMLYLFFREKRITTRVVGDRVIFGTMLFAIAAVFSCLTFLFSASADYWTYGSVPTYRTVIVEALHPWIVFWLKSKIPTDR